MSEPFPPYPGAGDPRFDPYDPLVSADYSLWWQRSTAILRRGWRPLLLVQLCTSLPALLLVIPAQVFIDMATHELQQNTVNGSPLDLGAFFRTAGGAVLALLVASLIYAIGTLACARMVVAIATGRELTPGRALASVLNRIPALIGWYLLGGLLTTAGVALCILPGVYVAAVLMILPVVVLFEPGNGIGRCLRLFNHDVGAAVARVVTIAAITIGISLLFGALSTMISLVLGGRNALDPAAVRSTQDLITDSVAGAALSGLGTLLTAVLITPMLVATYADLRARHEPFVTAHLPFA